MKIIKKDLFGKNHPCLTQAGFTLVELSIVLVIIGLIVGGVLVGQTLIRAAELRSLSAEMQSYVAAIRTFQLKYRGIPGDLRNATTFWGAAPNCFSMAESGQATCNGNGDGAIVWQGTYPDRPEMFTFWQHLSNAGLAPGTYTGIRGPGPKAASTVPGQNSPTTRMPGGCVSVIHATYPYTVVFTVGQYNMLTFGSLLYDVTDPEYCIAGLLTPIDAASLDTKIDNGRPGTGKIKSFVPAWNPNCADTNNPATAVYMTQIESDTCGLNYDFR